MMRSLPVLLLLWALMISSSLCATDGTSYSFQGECHQLTFQGIKKLILVQAQVNDQQGWFILDTGMKDLLLNSKHFKTLPPKEVPDSISLVDVRGDVMPTQAVDVQSFRWGAVNRSDFLVRACKLETMEKILRMDILGLIGMEVVRKLELIVDYSRHTLTMRRADGVGNCGICPKVPDYQLTFAYQNHLPALKTNLGNRSELWLGIDTGSSLSIIDQKLQRKLRRKTRSLSRIQYGSAHGVHEIPLGNVLELDLGQGLEFIYWRFAFNELEHFQKFGMHIDGLLGGDLFRLGVVSINFVNQQLSIWLQETTFLKRYPEIYAQAREKNRLERGSFTVACLAD